jgi:prepilin-type processing-associated H-X9-DG protein
MRRYQWRLVSDSTIARPAETIMLVDANTLQIFAECYPTGANTPYTNGVDYWAVERQDSYWGAVKGSIALRHNRGFNALFSDGHVKWLNKTTQSMWDSTK